MLIGLAQMAMGTDIEANFQKCLAIISDAAKQGVDLVCFPEVQITPFFAQYEKKDVSQYAIEIKADTFQRCNRIVKKKGFMPVPIST